MLPREFYRRGARVVARALLGRRLVSDVEGERVEGRIVEVEAYRGADDPASHAFRGPTPRNAAMFGPPGHAYVYFTYGMHHCVNVVCEPEGRAAAVLLRALEPLAGWDTLRRRRGRDDTPSLLRGPGCVAQGLGLTLEHDGLDLVAGPLRILDGVAVREGRIRSGPRIGIRRGVALPWRFWIENCPDVSGPRPRRPERGPRPVPR